MNKGNSADDCFPKFFKVYLPGESGDDLTLPISFNSFVPNSFPKNVTVKSIYGNVWNLELRKYCDDRIEKLFIVNGWKRIVKDEDLAGGEFLVFEFDGSRIFNFCIYGHTTCKRLTSLVQTNEIEDKSDDENAKSSENVIVLSDDNDDDDDGGGGGSGDNHDQNYGEEDRNSEDIIVLEEEEEEDDDDDDDEDNSSEDIIVLSSHDENYENEIRRDEREGKEKGSFSEDDKQYLDNEMNPFFTVNQNLKRKNDLRVPAKVVNTYDLHLSEFINLMDPVERKYGKLKREVKGHAIMGFGSIIRRNRVKSSDKMICELERERNGLVHQIKVHVIRG